MTRAILSFSLLIVALFAGGMLYLAMDRNGNWPAEAQNIVDIKPSPIGKCVNMGNALEAPNEGDWGYRIRQRDFETIRQAGFDTVRIPIKWTAHASDLPPYQIDPALLSRVDEVVQQALQSGLKVIINVHHYDEISEDARTHLPRLYGIWEQLFAHYQFYPQTVFFEFLNEPHSDMTARRVDDANRYLLSRLREMDQDRWVILGGGRWGTLDGLLETHPPYDPRAMVTFHYYSPFEFTHQGAPWTHKPIPKGQVWGSLEDRREMAKDFSRAARWRDQAGMPLLLGEFGVYKDVDETQRASWIGHVRKTAETVEFGWCYWDWATSLGIYDLEAENFKPGMENALFGE